VNLADVAAVMQPIGQAAVEAAATLALAPREQKDAALAAAAEALARRHDEILAANARDTKAAAAAGLLKT
jgi:glutamate-5-semialdehyde dehydrogenase